MDDNLKTKLPYCSAVIVAGGSSVRFGADKLFAQLQGQPVLGRSIEAMACCNFIQEIVLVVRQSVMDEAAELAEQYGKGKVKNLVPGGATRLESAVAGLGAVSPKTQLIGIHDGARPFVTTKLIYDAYEAAMLHGAAAPGIAVKDTIKISADGLVQSTPDRNTLFAVQTPQCFRAELIRVALAHAQRHLPTVTDDCGAVEALGHRIFLSVGSEENIKITSPLDLDLGEAILRRRQA